MGTSAHRHPDGPRTWVCRSTVIQGGTHAHRSALSSIVAKVRPSGIEQNDLLSSKATITLRMHAPHASTRTLWQEWLIAGAFRDRIGSDHTVVLRMASDPQAEVIHRAPERASVSGGASAAQTARRRFPLPPRRLEWNSTSSRSIDHTASQLPCL